jgi:hypothetical protein
MTMLLEVLSLCGHIKMLDIEVKERKGKVRVVKNA